MLSSSHLSPVGKVLDRTFSLASPIRPVYVFSPPPYEELAPSLQRNHAHNVPAKLSAKRRRPAPPPLIYLAWPCGLESTLHPGHAEAKERRCRRCAAA